MKSRHLLTLRIALAVFAIALTSAVRAAEPPPLEALVSAGFDLTIRVNVRQALDAESLQPLRDRLLNESTQPVIQMIQTVTGIDLLKDIDTVLFAGRYKDPKQENALFILRGRLEEESVLKMFQASPRFEKIPVGGGTLYAHLNQKKNKMEYFAFLGKGVLAMGQKKPVEESLLTLGDKTKQRMINNPVYRERLEAVKAHNLVNAVFLVPADPPSKNAVQKSLLKSARALGAGVTVGNGIQLGLNLAALDSRAARLWREMSEGGLALGQMIEQQPQIGALARRVILTSKGPSVSASLTLSLDEIMDLLAKNPKLRGMLGR